MTTYLITGATGDIASRIVHLLLARGHRPRLFVRNAAKARARFADQVDIVVGDLSDPTSLPPALDGIDSLFLVNSGPELATRDSTAANAAKQAGVKHLVKLSSMDSLQNVGTGAWHAQGEAAIRATGIPFTFVQPCGFMSNALWWASSIKSQGVVRAPTGEGRIPFIHSDDIAAVATKVLTTQHYIGQSLPITGPEALNHAEMTAKIAAAIHQPLRFESIPVEQEAQHMIDSGDSPQVVAAHVSIYRAIRDGRLSAVTGNVARVLGRNPITFDQWARENAQTFR